MATTATATLDTSDIDQYLGKTLDYSSLREPIANNDIRRWVHAMHYPNLLHYDPDFAAESRWGGIVAPQSFAIATDDGHGAAPACVGNIPNSHLLFGGDEWWFYGRADQAGRPDQERAHAVRLRRQGNQVRRPDLLPARRQLLPQPGRRADRQAALDLDPLQCATPAARRSTPRTSRSRPGPTRSWPTSRSAEFAWVQMLHDLGHKERWWDDVKVGDKLPERVFGPHSIASFTTEWRAYIVNTWGTMNLRKQRPRRRSASPRRWPARRTIPT